ncbi:MAG: aldose epimerase family protein [Bacillota bacterium]|nr:aldose epimerase family protein [Bacillota bacterium]
MSIRKKNFGKMYDGTQIDIFTLKNSKGMTVEITNFGGTVVSISVPDRNGKFADVALGYNSFEGYMDNDKYFGVILGRHANRIENAKFEINGVEYTIEKNDGENSLHGGFNAFDKKVWKAEIINKDGSEALQLSYYSKDGEEGFPGNMDTRVTYTLTEDNGLRINYYAVADKDTVINLSNHSYFNLGGHDSGSVLEHQLKIYADKFTANDEFGIPTGEIRDVKGTPMDFTQLTPVGPGLSSDYEQIIKGHGYDHNWVLKVSGKNPEIAAEVYEPGSGRVMEVYTTSPGVQFYSGNFIEYKEGCKNNANYGSRSGLCLETQYFPNSLNQKHFPSPVFKAGQPFEHTTIYKFSVR